MQERFIAGFRKSSVKIDAGEPREATFSPDGSQVVSTNYHLTPETAKRPTSALQTSTVGVTVAVSVSGEEIATLAGSRYRWRNGDPGITGNEFQVLRQPMDHFVSCRTTLNSAISPAKQASKC